MTSPSVPLGEWGHFAVLPDPIPTDPYDEDGYCRWCGNGKWKFHAPPCVWADANDRQREPAPSDQEVPRG